MSTLLEMRIEELEEQNAAMAATVDALRKAAVEPAIDAAIIYSVKVILNKAPQLHLRQVRADAVFDAVNEHEKKYGNSHFGRHLREYAASILAGKE